MSFSDTDSTPPMSPMMTDSGHFGLADAHRPAPAEIAVGRWSDAEHDLFLVGLDKYGREWKDIADVVRTRTVVQVRTHAQK